jgi:hypothetical protein
MNTEQEVLNFLHRVMHSFLEMEMGARRFRVAGL